MKPEFFILFLFRHGWLLFIAVEFFNRYGIRKEVKAYLELHPEQAPGYDKFQKTLFILSITPWVIMGVGDITGMTKTIFDFFFPRLLNPIVLLYHALFIMIWIGSVYWIYFKDGAEVMSTYPNRFNHGKPGGKKTGIKIIFAIMLIGGIAAEIFMWNLGGGAPNFHIGNH